MSWILQRRRNRWLVAGLLAMLLLAGCRKTPTVLPTDTNTAPAPTRTLGPTPTAREMLNPTATETPLPTETPIPGEAEVQLPDFSQVRLHAATYLENPEYFQVSLDGWPKNTPEGIVVRLGREIYTCERLFPEAYPFRVYCWGASPPEGALMRLEVILDQMPDPLVTLNVSVPYLPRVTDTPEN